MTDAVGEKNEKIVSAFIKSWSQLNSEALSQYFTEDGVYHNIPSGPIKGRAKIKKFIKDFSMDWKETEWEIITIISKGDTVVVERLDRTKTKTKKVNLPCMGVFILEDGKIKEWRDYFDLLTYMKGIGMGSLIKTGMRQRKS